MREDAQVNLCGHGCRGRTQPSEPGRDPDRKGRSGAVSAVVGVGVLFFCFLLGTAVSSSSATGQEWTTVTGSEVFARSTPRPEAVRRLRETLRVQALEQACGVEVLSTSVYMGSERVEDVNALSRRFTQTMTHGLVTAENVLGLEWVPVPSATSDSARDRLTMTLNMRLACDAAGPDSGLSVKAGFIDSTVIGETGKVMAGIQPAGIWISANRECYFTLFNLRSDGGLLQLYPGPSEDAASADPKQSVSIHPPTGQSLESFLQGAPEGNAEWIRIIATARPLLLRHPTSKGSTGAPVSGGRTDLEELSKKLVRIPRSERAETLLQLPARPGVGKS